MITPLFKANQKNAAECYGHGRQYGGKLRVVVVPDFFKAPKARPFLTLLRGKWYQTCMTDSADAMDWMLSSQLS